MKRLKVLSRIIICIIMFLITACSTVNFENGAKPYKHEPNLSSDKDKSTTKNIEEPTKGYTISFFDSWLINDLPWSGDLPFKIIRLENMLESSIQEVANKSIKDSMTSWISGKAVNASAVYLDIYCHSPQYLSFLNSLEYTGHNFDYINDYITIDMKTGKRVQLDDLIEINEEFVDYIQNNSIIQKSINPERFGGTPEYLWEYLNKFTRNELLEELYICSKTQEQVIQEGYYTIAESIGSIIFRNSFYLQNNKLIIVLDGDKHITFFLDDIINFLKVEKW
jgi:hypothetical protein